MAKQIQFSIRKDILGSGFKYRVQVKAFKHMDQLDAFLNKQPNNDWRFMREPAKSGMYIERGLGELINVKDIDPSALAHMG